MDEHIKLLEKEIKSLRINLDRVKNKPRATPEELANIERKLRLKQEILLMIIGDDRR